MPRKHRQSAVRHVHNHVRDGRQIPVHRHRRLLVRRTRHLHHRRRRRARRGSLPRPHVRLEQGQQRCAALAADRLHRQLHARVLGRHRHRAHKVRARQHVQLPRSRRRVRHHLGHLLVRLRARRARRLAVLGVRVEQPLVPRRVVHHRHRDGRVLRRAPGAARREAPQALQRGAQPRALRRVRPPRRRSSSLALVAQRQRLEADAHGCQEALAHREHGLLQRQARVPLQVARPVGAVAEVAHGAHHRVGQQSADERDGLAAAGEAVAEHVRHALHHEVQRAARHSVQPVNNHIEGAIGCGADEIKGISDEVKDASHIVRQAQEVGGVEVVHRHRLQLLHHWENLIGKHEANLAASQRRPLVRVRKVVQEVAHHGRSMHRDATNRALERTGGGSGALRQRVQRGGRARAGARARAADSRRRRSRRRRPTSTVALDERVVHVLRLAHGRREVEACALQLSLLGGEPPRLGHGSLVGERGSGGHGAGSLTLDVRHQALQPILPQPQREPDDRETVSQTGSGAPAVVDASRIADGALNAAKLVPEAGHLGLGGRRDGRQRDGDA
mmetsp:Transcript_2663/g.7937  ORF Transcript_2663/g.7937 Transcript_2663/m.7937 type:complete len:560 (-) Transcript_2663:29-1708(-)